MPSIPGPHPHFNHRGVLKWYPSFADGLAAAKAERKLWAVHIPWARSLPFVFYLDEEGQFLHGTSGGRSAVELLADLERVAVRR